MPACDICLAPMVLATYRLKTQDGTELYACGHCNEAFKDKEPPVRVEAGE